MGNCYIQICPSNSSPYPAQEHVPLLVRTPHNTSLPSILLDAFVPLLTAPASTCFPKLVWSCCSCLLWLMEVGSRTGEMNVESWLRSRDMDDFV